MLRYSLLYSLKSTIISVLSENFIINQFCEDCVCTFSFGAKAIGYSNKGVLV